MKNEIKSFNLESLINRLRTIRDMKVKLAAEERELSKPTLTDYSMIRKIWEQFDEFHKQRNTPMKRKQFVFIILFLFSPSALSGAKMCRGLRSELAKILRCTGSNVSHDYKNVSFYYTTYKTFRNDVNAFLGAMLACYLRG